MTTRTTTEEKKRSIGFVAHAPLTFVTHITEVFVFYIYFNCNNKIT